MNVILQACAYSSYKNRDFFVRQRRYCRGSVEYSGARCTSSTLPYSQATNQTCDSQLTVLKAKIKSFFTQRPSQQNPVGLVWFSSLNNKCQMSKGRCHYLQYSTVEPCAVLFWALGILLFQPPSGLAHRSTVIMSLYGHAAGTAVEGWFNSHRSCTILLIQLLLIYGSL